MYVIVWEFVVRSEAVERFEDLYGASGGWVNLFRGHRGYLDTELIADVDRAGRYLTIDRWVTQETYESFRAIAEGDVEKLDAVGRELTLEERFAGAFRG
jgi:hypothetical protein